MTALLLLTQDEVPANCILIVMNNLTRCVNINGSSWSKLNVSN